MAKLIFYRQEELDGSVRMGVELDDVEVLEHFEGGEGEPDPVIAWFVDVRCTGPGVPDESEAAIGWLLGGSGRIDGLLSGLAGHVRTSGVAPDILDIPSSQWEEAVGSGDETRIKVACMVIPNIDAEEAAEILDEYRDRWVGWIRGMIAQHHTSPA